MTTKQCLECRCLITTGRSDKKFCTIKCRQKHNERKYVLRHPDKLKTKYRLQSRNKRIRYKKLYGKCTLPSQDRSNKQRVVVNRRIREGRILTTNSDNVKIKDIKTLEKDIKFLLEEIKKVEI